MYSNKLYFTKLTSALLFVIENLDVSSNILSCFIVCFFYFHMSEFYYVMHSICFMLTQVTALLWLELTGATGYYPTNNYHTTLLYNFLMFVIL